MSCFRPRSCKYLLCLCSTRACEHKRSTEVWPLSQNFPLGAQCGPSELSLTPNAPVSPQFGGWALRMPQCSGLALGLGKSEAASGNSQGSGLALAQPGRRFLPLLGCETKCWAGSTNVQPHHSCKYNHGSS